MKKLFVLLFAALWLCACGDDESSNPASSGGDTPSTEKKDNGKDDSKSLDGCNFAKEDNVWKYKISSWNYIEEYTWVDETTVEFKEYMNSYHMDKSDSTYTGVNRDEFYETIMDECLGYQELDL
jgi:hypothetical protein